jgi:Kef-type K+ transport system membrane component KefB/nucleotide-binding universal stress UspA family protein
MIIAVVPPGEHQVLVFLVQVAVLVSLARIFGAAARRVGQPAVAGELIAGLVAGPSVFGRLAPSAFDWTFDGDAAMLFALGWLGLLLLLAGAGIESDLAIVKALGRPVVLVSIGSLVVPLAGGYVLGLVVPNALIGRDTSIGVYAAFLAVAMSISSLPVVARVLAELGMVRRNVGQLVLAAAVTNDVVGWLLLGLVVGVAGSGSDVTAGSVGTTIAAVLLFAVGALWLGGFAVDRSLRRLAGLGLEIHIGAVIFITAAGAAITQAIGVEAVLGAFVAGVIIGRSRWRDDRAIAVVVSMTNAVFAPLFFTTAGLRLDIGVFTDPTVAAWTVIIIVVASLTKLVGAGLGARLAGLPAPEARALGVGLNARGALEIVIASIGLDLGILTDASYAAVVVMALVTSIAAPPLLKRALRDWPGTPDEQERLAADADARRRVVISDRPPILLTRGRPGSIVAAQFVHLCWPAHHPIEVATTTTSESLSPIVNTFADRRIRISTSRNTGELVAKARRGYSAVAVGVNERPGEPLLGPLHTQLLADASLPVILVRRERITGGPLPPAFAHALIPITDSPTSKAALELGVGMAATLGTRLTLVHIVPEPAILASEAMSGMIGVAEPALRSATEAARIAGAHDVATIARSAENPSAEISRIALELEIDIVIIGTTITDGHLGPTATQVLRHVPATVAVIATPPGWTGPHNHY